MPTTPTPTEIIQNRAALETWMLDTADIKRKVTTQGDYGEDETWEVVAPGVACSVNALLLPGVQQLIGDRLSAVADSTICFPISVDVQVADQVVVTSKGDIQFEVLYVTSPETLDTGGVTYCREVT
jgi:hypothetical protein